VREARRQGRWHWQSASYGNIKDYYSNLLQDGIVTYYCRAIVPFFTNGMNIFKKFITAIKEHLQYFARVEHTEFEITPYRDWLMLVIVMAVASAILVGAAVYLFFLANSSEIAAIQETETRLFESVNEERLDEVSQIFTEREETFEKLLQTPPRIIDPSL